MQAIHGAVEEINQRSLVNIRDLSPQTATGAQQTTAASSELSPLAVDLNGMVARFRL